MHAQALRQVACARGSRRSNDRGGGLYGNASGSGLGDGGGAGVIRVADAVGGAGVRDPTKPER